MFIVLASRFLRKVAKVKCTSGNMENFSSYDSSWLALIKARINCTNSEEFICSLKNELNLSATSSLVMKHYLL